jgi:hypothetical protein
VTTGKSKCSTRCSVDGTRRTPVRGLLVDCRPVRKDGVKSEHSSTRTVRIRLPGRAVQYRTSEVRIRLQDSPVKKTDTADRQNTTGEGIIKKNPGARIQDREDKVFSLCVVRLCKK